MFKLLHKQIEGEKKKKLKKFFKTFKDVSIVFQGRCKGIHGINVDWCRTQKMRTFLIGMGEFFAEKTHRK